MAKTTTAGGSRPRPSESAGREYHARRIEARASSLEKKRRRAATAAGDGDEERAALRRHRSAALSHDTEEKRDASRLRLHIARVRREADALRKRLGAWDDVEERRRGEREREEADRKRRDHEDSAKGIKKEKRGRLGPETWKLRGAARPAWEVYDFDTRYVDPHLKEHEEAREKARRVRNILSLYRGRFGEEGGDDPPPQPHCRRFLSLLTQLGHLSFEAGRLKSAREAFLECMELEGTAPGSVAVTPARARLMRMYVDSNRPGSARRLWERLPHDGSAWIRYSAALLEYVSWRLLGEEGSTEGTAGDMLRRAIECNPFCAYNIAFHRTFTEVIEYGDEVEDAEPGTVGEAVEYCHSEQMGAWLGTEGAMEWVRDSLLDLLNGDADDPTRVHLESWEERLKEAEADFLKGSGTDGTGRSGGNEDVGNVKEGDDEHDFLMYAGMFRTAIDMLQHAGAFLKAPNEEVATLEWEDRDRGKS